MKKYFITILLAAGIYFPALAQNKVQRYRFSSINNFVVTGGDNTISGGFQTVNGFRRDQWFAGLGAGIDFYLYRTVPVFIDLRREFGKKKNKLFVYADAGMNIEWLQDEYYQKPSTWDPNRNSKFHNGIFTDAGAGLFAGSKKDHGFIVSLGLSTKTFKETRSYSDWLTGTAIKDIYKFSFSRAVLKLGWKF